MIHGRWPAVDENKRRDVAVVLLTDRPDGHQHLFVVDLCRLHDCSSTWRRHRQEGGLPRSFASKRRGRRTKLF